MKIKAGPMQGSKVPIIFWREAEAYSLPFIIFVMILVCSAVNAILTFRTSERKKNNKEKKKQATPTSLASNMWVVPNWRPWVHFHSSFFFLFYFPFAPPPANMSTEACFPVNNAFTVNTSYVQHARDHVPNGRERLLNVLIREHLTVARDGWGAAEGSKQGR